MQKPITAERLRFIGKGRAWQENYNTIRKALLAHHTSVFKLPHPVSQKEADQLIFDVLGDIDWPIGASPIVSVFKDNDKVRRVQLQFYLSQRQMNCEWAKSDAIANALVKYAARHYSSEPAQVAFFTAWLINNVEFGPWPITIEDVLENTELAAKLARAQSLTGVFLDRQAVCHGLARAMKLLCNRANIECWIVFGRHASYPDTWLHAWNMIILEGKPFYLDIVLSKQFSTESDGDICFPLLMDMKALEELGYIPFDRPFADSSFDDSNMQALQWIRIKTPDYDCAKNADNAERSTKCNSAKNKYIPSNPKETALTTPLGARRNPVSMSG